MRIEFFLVSFIKRLLTPADCPQIRKEEGGIHTIIQNNSLVISPRLHLFDTKYSKAIIFKRLCFLIEHISKMYLIPVMAMSHDPS